MDGVNHHHPHAYLEEMDEDPEVDMSNYYDDETDQDYQEIFPKQETASFERPHVPLRKLLPKGNLNRKLNNNNNSTSNNNNNNGNAAAGNNRRQTVGVGHSLSLYRQQPLKNLASRKHFFIYFFPVNLFSLTNLFVLFVCVISRIIY